MVVDYCPVTFRPKLADNIANKMDEFEMNDIHKEVLTQNRKYLLQNIIMTEEFCGELVMNKVFTDEMFEDIQVRGCTSYYLLQ